MSRVRRWSRSGACVGAVPPNASSSVRSPPAPAGEDVAWPVIGSEENRPRGLRGSRCRRGTAACARGRYTLGPDPHGAWVDGAARRTSILIAAPHSSLPPSRRATGPHTPTRAGAGHPAVTANHRPFAGLSRRLGAYTLCLRNQRRHAQRRGAPRRRTRRTQAKAWTDRQGRTAAVPTHGYKGARRHDTAVTEGDLTRQMRCRQAVKWPS